MLSQRRNTGETHIKLIYKSLTLIENTGTNNKVNRKKIMNTYHDNMNQIR